MTSRKAKIAVALSASLIFSLSVTSSAQAATTQTIKNLYLTVVVPKQIKMPKGECSSFNMKYTLGIKAKQNGYGYVYTSLLIGSDAAAGVRFSYNMGYSSDAPESGTFKIKYCKNDWIDNGNARIGVVPGTYTFGFVTTFPDEVEKLGKIKIVK
jgi:hypothetical protein